MILMHVHLVKHVSMRIMCAFANRVNNLCVLMRLDVENVPLVQNAIVTAVNVFLCLAKLLMLVPQA